MAKTYDVDYDSIQSKINEKTKQQQAEYEAKRKQAAEDYINRYNQAADIASKPVIEGYEQDIAKVPQQYAAGFNANAVQERINAKNVAERMANMGMTDSGLNRTQQTALTLQRGNADARLREQQQNAIDELTRALNEYKAQQSANKLQNAGNIYQQADVDTANNLTSLYNSARDTATNLYGTNVSANTAQEQMAQEAAIAQAERDLQLQKLQQEAAIAQANRELQEQLQREQLEYDRGQNTLDRATQKWLATHSGSSSSDNTGAYQDSLESIYKALLNSNENLTSEAAYNEAVRIVNSMYGKSSDSSGSSGSTVTGNSGSSGGSSGRSAGALAGGTWSNDQTLAEAAGLTGNDYTTQMRILYQGGRVNDQDALDSIFGHAYEEQALSGGNSFTAMNNALSIAKAIGIPDSAIQSYQKSSGLKWDNAFNS